MSRTDQELREEVDRLFWWHEIELRPGIVTPGHANVQYMLPHFGIPEDLTGVSVLDIGCWDGFYSFECERRGAARVVASDLWEAAGREGFDLARQELGSNAEPLQADVYDLPEVLEGEQFDLVLFLGVLYHLKHPLLALEKVAACVKPGGRVIVDTIVAFQQVPYPAVAFYPGAEVGGDPTNWWAPNFPAMAGMLATAGFTTITCPVFQYCGNRSVFQGVKASAQEAEAQAIREDRERHKYQVLREQEEQQ